MYYVHHRKKTLCRIHTGRNKAYRQIYIQSSGISNKNKTMSYIKFSLNVAMHKFHGYMPEAHYIDPWLVDYIKDMVASNSNKIERKLVNNMVYVWVNLTAVTKAMPYLGIKSKSVISERLEALARKKIIHKIPQGQKIFACLTPVADIFYYDSKDSKIQDQQPTVREDEQLPENNEISFSEPFVESPQPFATANGTVREDERINIIDKGITPISPTGDSPSEMIIEQIARQYDLTPYQMQKLIGEFKVWVLAQRKLPDNTNYDSKFFNFAQAHNWRVKKDAQEPVKAHAAHKTVVTIAQFGYETNEEFEERIREREQNGDIQVKKVYYKNPEPKTISDSLSKLKETFMGKSIPDYN